MTEGRSRTRAAQWLYLDHFGFSKAPAETDAEVVRKMALALMTAAIGDGQPSDAERRWILGYPPAVIEEMSKMSVANMAALPELMQVGILRQSGRILVYDAIRAASVDGYKSGERAAVRRTAQLLGIDEKGVIELEQLVADEEALKPRRIKVLMPSGHLNLDPRYQP
jgi:uncharacterized membrane protein YebE (DUF533 family)